MDCWEVIFALNFSLRKVFRKSCSSFSGFFTPAISKVLPFCTMPKMSQPPLVLANAETVSHVFLGISEAAAFTSKSSHSISAILSINSALVIFLPLLQNDSDFIPLFALGDLINVGFEGFNGFIGCEWLIESAFHALDTQLHFF